ncbi:MAG TPA: UvrD-helicase domain-containing protein [Firmicutes bacterium]|nr:UvrD-helicase domain-containing protein [Bacillota bacterium]
MSFDPTPSQWKAITTTDQPLAVTAGAGSGKTRVLVERYLHLLEIGVSVDEIAAITFTKKAAQEMKDRLRNMRPDLIESLEQAQISTIHSLCQRIIQEHPLQAKIDPRFRVGEEWETKVLLTETIAEVIEESDPPDTLETAGETAEIVLALYETMLSKGDLDFRRPLEPVEEEFPLEQLYDAVRNVLALQPTTEKQAQVLGDLQDQWRGLAELLAFPDDELRLEALDVLLKLVKGIRGKLAEQTSHLKALIEEARQNILEAQGQVVVAYLGEVLEQVHERYDQKKRLFGILDYNDLEQLTYSLLQDDTVRADYPFRHLMVDEFQDTNPLQKKIVDALVSQGAKLFVVGDPKQSIYRFRGADVEVFVQTKDEIEEVGTNVFLEENFRSRPELIDFVNAFFRKLLSGESIGFEESAAAREDAGQPCVTILRTPADDLLSNEARAAEAQQIALKIRDLVDQGGYRYEQISILFRAMTNVHIYERALKEAGVPYVNLGGRGFYTKQEIQDVLHYFRWLEDPEDEVAKLAVLRSPFYLISDEGLYWIRQDRLDQLTQREQEAYQTSQEDYLVLVAQAKYRPAPEVISALLERTDYVVKTWRLPFGPQKVANIEKLLEQSWDLFARDVYTLPEQARFLRLMVHDGQKEGEALLDAEHADVVVLRTIHGSKGLEFPVVFLADTNAGLFRAKTGKVLYHPDFGLTYKGMRNHEVLKEREKQEELSEAKRLLYVAMTRAEEKFYFCARDGKLSRESWWTWLQDVLQEIPGHLYEEVPGTLSPLEEERPQTDVLQPSFPTYAPLQPQYNQVSFSVTSLMNYARCPRYYYLRYILGLPERKKVKRIDGTGADEGSTLSGTQRGNIVHRVCEQIRDAANLSELIDYAATMEGVELDHRQKAQLEEIITPYLESAFFRRVQAESKQDRVYQEHDFVIPAGDFVVNGLVDQVFVRAEGVEIVDFKSNWIRKEQLAEVGASYDVQLRLYAWAMAREFGLPVLSAQAYFLIPNRLYGLDTSLLDADATERWLMQTCATIIQGTEVGVEAFPIMADCSLCTQQSYCKTSNGNPASFGENTGIDMEWAEEEWL